LAVVARRREQGLEMSDVLEQYGSANDQCAKRGERNQ
jgi:hypothetical protein